MKSQQSLSASDLEKIIRIGNLSRECIAENQFATIMNHELMSFFKSSSAVFMEFDQHSRDLKLNSSMSYGIDSEHSAHYMDHFHRLDPCFQKLIELTNLSPQQSVSTEQVIESEHSYINSEYYKDFLTNTGVHRSLVFSLANNQRPVGLIGLHRNKKGARYDDKDHLKVQLIAPYLATAVMFRHKERELRQQRMLKDSILNSSNINAYLLFNQNLVCVDSGGETRNLTVAENSDVNNIRGWHCDELLSEKLNLLVRKKLDSHSTLDDELSVTFDNLVHAAHIRLETFENDTGEHFLLIMILNENIEIVCEHRMQYFGLTVREQEVVKLVQFGLTNPQVSSSLHISPKTVENHLTRIYAKTHTHNKTSLLRQLHV